MKATEQYFLVVLFIMLYKVVQPFDSVDESWSATIQMKATEQYFLVVLFIVPYKVVPTFQFVERIFNCDHSDESYLAVFFVVLFNVLYKVVLILTCELKSHFLKCNHSNESCWAVPTVMLFSTSGISLNHLVTSALIYVLTCIRGMSLVMFQTKTQMNDLMDLLIQDMSTGTYTTKRPYPVQRSVLK